MGIGGISPGSLILIFLIAVLLFGTKRLRGLGEDLGGALASFRKSMKEESTSNQQDQKIDDQSR